MQQDKQSNKRSDGESPPYLPNMNTLRKIMLLLAVLVCTAVTANAGLKFGIKAGLNVNSFHFNKEKLFDSDNRCGWTGGVIAEYMLPMINLGVDASVMYTRMNAESQEKVAGATLNSDNLGKDFIEIPINVKYKFGLPVVGSIFKPYVYTGPAFAFKLNKNTVEYFKTKTCQVAWNIGLGFEFFNHLQLQGSYGFGLNDAITATIPVVNVDTSVKAKNNYWTVTAAWLF